MAEAPNGRITLERPADGTSPFPADMKAAIRETRNRLAAQVAQTADHVHLLFTTPASVKTEAPVGGVVAGAIKAIAVAGRARRVWTDARRTGLLRRGSDRRGDCGHRGCARDEDTTSLRRRIEQPEDDMAKKAQKRAGAKRARPAGKRDLVRRPKASAYAKRTARGRFKEMDDVGRSQKADKARKAKKKVRSGYGDQGDERYCSISNCRAAWI